MTRNSSNPFPLFLSKWSRQLVPCMNIIFLSRTFWLESNNVWYFNNLAQEAKPTTFLRNFTDYLDRTEHLNSIFFFSDIWRMQFFMVNTVGLWRMQIQIGVKQQLNDSYSCIMLPQTFVSARVKQRKVGVWQLWMTHQRKFLPYGCACWNKAG